MSSLFYRTASAFFFRGGGWATLQSRGLRLSPKWPPSTNKGSLPASPNSSLQLLLFALGLKPINSSKHEKTWLFDLKRMITSQCLCFQRPGLQCSPELPRRTVTAALRGSAGGFGVETQRHFKLRNLWRSRFKKKNQSYWKSTIYKLRSKHTELGSRESWILVSSLPLPISVTLSKSLNLSGPQFVHLQNEGMEEISGSRCWSVGEMHLIFWEKLWKLSRQSSARFWFVWLECVRNL